MNKNTEYPDFPAPLQTSVPSSQPPSYLNPAVNHGVNVTRESHIATFFKLIAKICILIIFILVAIYFSFRLIASYIPFSVEENLAQKFAFLFIPENDKKYVTAQQELQKLAETLAQHMNAPADMPLHIYISSDRAPNASATLGGYIVIHQGAINAISSENALAMILAHEIAHVKNRDPLTSLGTGILFSLALTIMTGSESASSIIGNFTNLSFSRQQESAADKDALRALNSYYGHTQGADEFFSYVLELEGKSSPPEFLNTHPDSAKRLSMIKRDQTRVTTKEHLTPLSSDLKKIQNSRP